MFICDFIYKPWESFGTRCVTKHQHCITTGFTFFSEKYGRLKNYYDSVTIGLKYFNLILI